MGPLHERKLILDGPTFHFHDYGRKGISCHRLVYVELTCLTIGSMSVWTEPLVRPGRLGVPKSAKLAGYHWSMATGRLGFLILLPPFKRKLDTNLLSIDSYILLMEEIMYQRGEKKQHIAKLHHRFDEPL